MWKRTRDLALAWLVTVFYRAYSRLWSVVHIRRPELLDGPEPVICAHWHGDELLLIGGFSTASRNRMAVMASRSRDGELLMRILTWMGFRVVRGSSTRGGAGGLKGLIDAVNKERCHASLAVDGPRGPIYRVKPGILKLAQETGRPLVLGAASARRRFIFKKAWNRCYLPFPFSKCVIIYGEPIEVPATLSDESFEALRLRLEDQLLSLKTEA